MGHYIVLDLEWNQSSGGREASIDRLPFEIIEIGAVKLDESLRIVSEFRRLVRPQVYRTLHYKISEVTHLTAEQLEREGERFERVMEAFNAWCGEDAQFCTWGSMDLTELQRNIVYHGLEIPFARPLYYFDLQKLYGLIKGDGSRESLDTAVSELGIEEGRPFHRALDDAWYTGLVMGKMGFDSIKEYISVDYYQPPEEEEEEISLEFPGYSKFVSRTWKTKEELLAEKQVTDVVCCKCRRMLRKKIRWFPVNQRYYFCLAVCPVHGYVRGKIRIKKAEDGSVFAVRTVKLTDQAGVETIVKRREESKKKRAERAKARKEARRKDKAHGE